MLRRRGVFGLDKNENAKEVVGYKSFGVKEVQVACNGTCGETYTFFDETFTPVKCALCGSEKITISKKD